MPYIKKELRPRFDIIVKLAKDGWNIFNCVNNIIVEIKKLPLKSQDGCLNYIFTQLFRNVDKNVAEIICGLTLVKLFIKEDISYYNLSRAVAILVNMIDEFKRRKWDNRNDEVNFLLNQILYEIKLLRNNYEDSKIYKNGDLD